MYLQAGTPCLWSLECATGIIIDFHVGTHNQLIHLIDLEKLLDIDFFFLILNSVSYDELIIEF